jgi:hypothetical protein
MTVGQVLQTAAAAAAAGGFDQPGAHADRMVLELDEQGWNELSEMLAGVLEEAARIQERSNDRRSSRDPGALRPSALAILHHAIEP